MIKTFLNGGKKGRKGTPPFENSNFNFFLNGKSEKNRIHQQKHTHVIVIYKNLARKSLSYLTFRSFSSKLYEEYLTFVIVLLFYQNSTQLCHHSLIHLVNTSVCKGNGGVVMIKYWMCKEGRNLQLGSYQTKVEVGQ